MIFNIDAPIPTKGVLMRGHRLKVVVLVFLFTVGLFPVHARSAELIPLRATYASIGGAFAPLWIAQDKGVFNKYGLAVDLKYMLSATGTQALLSGSTDIVNPGTELVEAGLAGARVAFIIGILNRAVLSVYSKPELKQFTDLKGKVLGVTLPGSTTDLAARMLIQQAGMVAGKDIQVTHLQGMPDMITALAQGRIDAGIVSAPTTLRAKQAGLKELVDIAARNIPMIHAGLATTRDFIKSDRDKVRRYVQAYIEANKIARTDPETAKQVIAKWTKTDNKEDLEETYNTYVKAWEQAPLVSLPAMQTVLNFAINPNAKTAKPEQFIDNSFVAELEKSGFIKELYK
ncbi:MAG: transporter substrate-binding domain-containing protein [Deltaproteobacteria bacterium]|nr:transporter substrate-binding domain-containing protein [Deltaproteobacteria bacterium]